MQPVTDQLLLFHEKRGFEKRMAYWNPHMGPIRLNCIWISWKKVSPMFQTSGLIFRQTLVVFFIAVSAGASAQVASLSAPGARWGHVLIHDREHDQILLFGGARERGVYLNDTWLWDKGKWRQVSVEGPSARGFSAVTFHEKRKTVILHGGRGNEQVTNSDTWEWNGFQWHQLESDTSFPADHHQMVYLPKQDKILAFGGWTGEDVSGETWFWDSDWEKIDVPGPSKRASFGMAYNTRADKVLVFGGLWVNGQYADLWEWSNDAWQQAGGPYDHSSLDHLSMVYDGHTDQVVLFGGKNYRRQMQRNTLSIGGNGEELLSSVGPSPRHSVGFTYDSNAGVGYLYGGKEYQGDEQVALADFWKWDGTSWVEVNIPSQSTPEIQ